MADNKGKKVCLHCGTENSADAWNCVKCGHILSEVITEGGINPEKAEEYERKLNEYKALKNKIASLQNREATQNKYNSYAGVSQPQPNYNQNYVQQPVQPYAQQPVQPYAQQPQQYAQPVQPYAQPAPAQYVPENQSNGTVAEAQNANGIVANNNSKKAKKEIKKEKREEHKKAWKEKYDKKHDKSKEQPVFGNLFGGVMLFILSLAVIVGFFFAFSVKGNVKGYEILPDFMDKFLKSVGFKEENFLGFRSIMEFVKQSDGLKGKDGILYNILPWASFATICLSVLSMILSFTLTKYGKKRKALILLLSVLEVTALVVVQVSLFILSSVFAGSGAKFQAPLGFLISVGSALISLVVIALFTHSSIKK